MKKDPTLEPSHELEKTSRDGQIIVLTRRSETSKSSLPDSEDLPVEMLSNRQQSHTLDNIVPDSLRVAKHATNGEEPLLVLAKRSSLSLSQGLESHVEEDGISNDSIPPLPEDSEGDPAVLVPDILSTSLGEEDLLFEMSRELNFSMEEPLRPKQGLPLSVLETDALPRAITPSFEDLPWISSAESPLSTTIPLPQEPGDWMSSASSIPQADDGFLNDLAMTMGDPLSPDGSAHLDVPIFTLAPPAVAEQTPVVAEQAPLAAEQAPSVPELHAQSASSTHVDVDLSDDMFVQGLLDQLSLHCGRVCLFVYKAPLLLGFDAKVREQHSDGPVTHQIKDVLFPTHLSSTLAQVIQTQTPYIGVLPEIAIDRVLFACLGGGLPTQLAIYPIVQNHDVVALFTLDSHQGQAFLSQRDAVESLIKRAHELDYRWHPPDLLSYFEQLSNPPNPFPTP